MIRLLRESGLYFLVSAAALAVDYSLLVGLTKLAHVPYLVSAAIGFAAGLLVNYALSVTVVFRQHRMENRGVELLIFVGIGLIGLALNEVLMKAFVDGLRLDVAVAKLPATAVGFVFNFGARKILLFSRT